MPPSTLPPVLPTTTPMNTRLIDEIIPRFTRTPEPTGIAGSGLSASDVRLIGIAAGALVVGLIVCVIVIILCLRKRRRRAPKLPPRRLVNGRVQPNQEYATIEEMQMTRVRSPGRVGRAYPNVLYRSESLSALTQANGDPSMHRSVSDFERLGEPPQPPAPTRQLSLLPGMNPALIDTHDGQTAPIDDFGYTKYLPDTEPPSLPYMHLKVTPTLSDPASHSRKPPTPHRYRSNTSDTHANAADVDRILNRIRAREDFKDGANRRFVPNQSGRNTSVGEEYNRSNRSGHKAIPRSKKHSTGAFTPVPVHGHYQSKSKKPQDQDTMRKWKSLPDMTDEPSGGAHDLTLGTNSDHEGPPVYQILESSPASSISDYSRRHTSEYQQNGGVHPAREPANKPHDNGGRGSKRVASESAPGTYRASPGHSDTMGDRYDPVYEPRTPNGTPNGGRVPTSPGIYQPLVLSNCGQEEADFDEGAYQGTDEWLDGDAYLEPTTSLTGCKQDNGVFNGGRGGMTSPTGSVPNKSHNDPGKSGNQPYIYESDNNNLSPKTNPTRTVGGNSYAALQLRQTEDTCDIVDDMDNEEYMYQPTAPNIDITA